MNYFKFSKTKSVQTVQVEKFFGVDFLNHPTKVDLNRSPDCLNIISDEAYFLKKRTGYKKLLSFEGVRINGIFYFKKGDTETHVCHAGTMLYKVDLETGEKTSLYTGMADERSTAFNLSQKLYILDGKKFLVYDGETVKSVSETAFVPTTSINRTPDGAGVPFEAVNLLTPKRINTFMGNGSTRSFRLDCDSVLSIQSATVNGTAVSYSSNFRSGTITFNSPPSNGNGIANVVVSFTPSIEDSSAKINKCKFFGMYGGKNDTRVFISGNPDEPNVDYQSGLYDASYFPDTGYTKIGADSSAIMGYARQYDSQIIIKESNGQDATQYLRTYSLDQNGTALYPIKQGAKGIGAISSHCFATLGDIPLFLSNQGVGGVFGTNILETRTISNLSERINPKLTAEIDLEDAVAIEFNNRYYLSLNGNCYVADGKYSYLNGQAEWFFWDNIPARCFMESGSKLYFGTKDGDIMLFVDENDENAYRDDDKAINCYWKTPFSALGAWNLKKNITSIFPVVMPSLRSSVFVKYNTENKVNNTMLERNVDLFSFLKLDFTRFSFKSIKTANIYRDRQKIRGVKLFQAVIGNEKIDEPFGILAIMIKFVYSNQIR